LVLQFLVRPWSYVRPWSVVLWSTDFELLQSILMI